MSVKVITIKVENIDRSENIDPLTFSLNRAITNQADTLSFTVPRTKNTDWKPELLNEIFVYDTDGVTVLFSGTIVTIEETMINGIEYVKCNCKDWSFEMDRLLVVKSYSNQTVNAIIADIQATYLNDFTITNVDCPVEIDYIAFNYEYPTKVLQQLADLTNYDWYVDATKDLHFFAKNSITAPFSLTDTGGKYYVDTLVIKKDATKIKNSITVRGGEYLGSSFTEPFIADGTQITFPLGKRYDSVSVTVGGVSKTVGISNVDDSDAFDCMFDPTNKAVTFKQATKPAIGVEVAITGNPYAPVITKKSSSISVGTYGVFEYKVVDNTISSKASARERAEAELSQFAEALDEGSFDTKEAGLEVGQLINIQSTLRNINDDFIITRITTTIEAEKLNHKVTLATTSTFGMIEFLQKLLTSKDKEIIISANEVLDQILSAGDAFGMGDNITSITHKEPPYYYGGGSETLYRIALTIDHTKLTGSVPSSQEVWLDLSDLPDGFFDNVQPDGSDIKIYESDDETEVTVDLVSIDTVAKTGELFFTGVISPLADTIFYLHYKE